MLIVVLNPSLDLRLGLMDEVHRPNAVSALILGSSLQLRFCLTQMLQCRSHVRLIFTPAATVLSSLVSSFAVHEDAGILSQLFAHARVALQECS